MRLNAAEKKWLDALQALLLECPSDRLGFYTIGDAGITVYDFRKEEKINDLMDSSRNLDFPGAVVRAKADIGISLVFPSCVHSVSG